MSQDNILNDLLSTKSKEKLHNLFQTLKQDQLVHTCLIAVAFILILWFATILILCSIECLLNCLLEYSKVLNLSYLTVLIEHFLGKFGINLHSYYFDYYCIQKSLKWKPPNGMILSDFELNQIRLDLNANLFDYHKFTKNGHLHLFAHLFLTENLFNYSPIVQFQSPTEGLLHSLICHMELWVHYVHSVSTLVDLLAPFDEHLEEIRNPKSRYEKRKMRKLKKPSLHLLDALDGETKQKLFCAQLEMYKFICENINEHQFLRSKEADLLRFVVKHKIKYTQMMTLVVEPDSFDIQYIRYAKRKILKINFYEQPNDYFTLHDYGIKL